MRKYFSIVRLLTVVFLIGCSGPGAFVSETQKTKSEPHPQAMNYFIDGVMHDLKENFSAALLSYQEALLYDSTSSTIYTAIAKDYLMLGKEESARRFLRRALDVDPQDLDSRDFLLKITMNRKEWDAAEQLCLEMLRIDPTRKDFLYFLAGIYGQKNEKEKAAKIYQRILTTEAEPDPQPYLLLGELYLDLKKYAEAVQVYEGLVKLDSNVGVGFYGIGLAKEALGDSTAAAENFSKALDLSPDLMHARARLNNIYLGRKEWDSAISNLQELVDMDSSDISSWLDIAEIYRQRGDTTAALQKLDDVKQRFPDDWRAYLDAGRIQMDQQKFEPAFLEFDEVVKRSPETFWGWLFSGISLFHLDSLSAAHPRLSKALTIQPQDPLANYYMGSLLTQRNQNQDAISYLKTALTGRPDWIAVMTILAGAYESLKEYTLSESLFVRALELDPENSLLLNNYGYSLSERGVRLDEALEMAHKALSSDPENGAYLDTVGWIYFKKGSYEEAKTFIEKAFQKRDQSAVVADHLGDVYEKLGMHTKAVEAWEAALQIDQDNEQIQEKINKLME